jgi:threonine dehydratase
VVRTPLTESPHLSDACGSHIFTKPEYLQYTGSFKERGARNALELLPADQRQRGVIAASAGNHALGLSFHARALGIPATVVMPRFAPLTKVNNCRKLGATVVLHGDTFGDARRQADAIAAERGQAYINGYDHPAIIAGQGTIGLEMLEDVPELDAIIIPIGGGGLAAGIALAAKALKPALRIIGVEPERAACFTAALQAGKPVEVPLKPTLADGLSVPQAGVNSFRILRPLLDDLVLVSEQEVARAILRLMEWDKAVVEGAGAAGVAACLAGKVPQLAGCRVAIPLCGGNIDLTTLDLVIERGLASEGRLWRFTATISDRPGGLARLAGIIAEEGASIMDIAHERRFAGEDVTTVAVQCVLETSDGAHIQRLEVRLRCEGYELAKPT